MGNKIIASAWSVAITRVVCSLPHAQKPLSKSDTSYADVQAQVHALMQTPAVQKILANRPKETQHLRLEIEGTRFQLLDQQGNKLFDNSHVDQKDLYEQPLEHIHTIATRVLTPPPSRAPSPPALPPPHPMNNEGLYCFANSAYQLLSNIPSLKTSVLERLPPKLAKLKEYSQIHSGQQLVELWNQNVSETEQFTPQKGHMASEFLERIMTQTTHKSFAPLKTVSTRKNPQAYAKVVEHVAPSAFVGLSTSGPGQEIDFHVGLKQGMITDTDPAAVGNEDVISSRSFFIEAPKQLFVKIDRFKNNAKDPRPIKNIPFLLDPKALVDTSVKSEPLELKGFLVHQGHGLGDVGGHYVAYLKLKDEKHPNKYHWICANDSKMITLTQQDVAKALEQASDLYYDHELTPALPTSAPSTLFTSLRKLFGF